MIVAGGSPKSRWVGLLVAVALVTGAPAEDGYRTPPPALADMVDAPTTPDTSLSPDGTRMVLMERRPLSTLAELSRPELRLAGMRLSPATDGRSRQRPGTSLTIKTVADLAEVEVTGLPADAGIADVTWSADSSRFAFTVTLDDRIELWIAGAAAGKSRRLSDARVSLALGARPCWTDGGREMLYLAVPADRGAPPAQPRVPAAPVIEESRGRVAPARTYQDLLENGHDADLFEYYGTTRLERVNLDGQRTPIGQPAMYDSFDPSPGGRYILVEQLHRPFSYRVPAERFPRKIEIWDAQGKLVRRLADLPLQEEIPIAFGSVATDPRAVGWRADAPATLVWAEALDGGDAGAEADERDRLFMLPAPFAGPPATLLTLGLRYRGTQWGNDGIALVSSRWWKTRQTRTWRVAPGDPNREPVLVVERSFEDRYADPGDPVTRTNRFGRSVLQLTKDGKALFLIGSGASPEGDRPFFDRMEITTGLKQRLFRSQPPHFERPLTLLDETGPVLLTLRESKEEPPNLFTRRVGGDGEPRQLTDFPHPTPQLRGLQKERIRYERDDGVDMTATLYLPPGYDKSQGSLPVVVWAYPQEFKSADAAGQVTDSPHRFDRVGWWSPLLFLARGYAVLDDPSMPIIGEGDEEPNDTYVEQLVASARAAVREVARRGVGDADRFAIGGHSYGAFMAANLLAHSDLFRAGIARSGAYNRTLTPFSFQSEERTLWEAPDVYFTMSPFMHADRIDEPLLLIHGDADNNSGTFPMQSERMFSALKGHGAVARLVMLPNESHGYRARESVLHMLWEMDNWLETHVKQADPRERPVGG